MLKQWLKVCYAAMMFKQKRKTPEDWQNKMVYIINYYLFFFFAAVASNIMIHFKIFTQKDKLYIYGVMAILALIIFNSNKKWIRSFLSKSDISKNYKRNSYKEFLCLLLFFASFILSVFFLIFSHRIQNYI